jgi:pyrroline-5-carboxylate reductase
MLILVFTVDDETTNEEKIMLQSLLHSVGLCYEVPESQINAYCGLFSSGIGFMFQILEALSDGAVKMGIPRDKSLEIAAQTMKGAAELLLQDKTHPGVLKDAVCSPGTFNIHVKVVKIFSCSAHFICTFRCYRRNYDCRYCRIREIWHEECIDQCH